MGRHHADTETIRSGHLYQLVSYLQNLSARDGRDVEGLLLYPQVDREWLLDYQLMGRKVRVATVDLNAKDSEQIGAALVRLTSTEIRPASDQTMEAHPY